MLIPTINSLDTTLLIIPGPKPIVIRKPKETFVFKTTEDPDQTNNNGSLRTQLKKELGPSIFDEDPCQLPYEAGLDFQVRVGLGVNALFAGATGGVQMNLGGGISYGDDRNFSAHYYYHFSAYIKAYLLASSVDASYLFYGRQVDKYFDGINHFSRYMDAFASAKLHDIKKACSVSVGQRPKIPAHFEAIKKPSIWNVEVEGITMAERKFDVSYNSSSSKDLYIRTKDGVAMNGSTQNTTFSIKGIFPTFSLGNIAELNIIVNLIFDKVDNNYNTNNDGEYLGIALDFIITPKSGNEPSVAVKEDLYKKVQKTAKSFERVLDTLLKFFANYKSATPSYYSIREVLKSNQRALADELKKITLDPDLTPKKPSSGFSFTGSLGMEYLRYYVREDGSFKRQYSRISVLGNIEIGYRKEVRYGLFIGELDAKLDLSMKAAITESATDQTTTYLHTVFDGVNSNIEGGRRGYNALPIGQGKTNSFLPYWRNHKDEFGTKARDEHASSLSSVATRRPVIQGLDADIGEQNAMHYLERFRQQKLASDDKKWIKEKDRTLSISMSIGLQEKRIRSKVFSTSAFKFATLKAALVYSGVGNVVFTGVIYKKDGVNKGIKNGLGISNELFFNDFLKREIRPERQLIEVKDIVLNRFATAWNFKTTNLESNVAGILAYFEGIDKYFDFQDGAKQEIARFKSKMKKNIFKAIKNTGNSLPDKIFKSLTQARDDVYRMFDTGNDSNQNIDLGLDLVQDPIDKFDFTPTSYHRNFVATGIVAEDYLDRFVNLVLLHVKIN